MKARDLMIRAVATVRPHDDLRHAAALMRDRGCGCAVVVDHDEHPIGLLTDRDICFAALQTGEPLAAIGCGASMQRPALVCRAHDSIAAAEDIMSLHQVRRLPVVDGEGRLVGLLALDDIAREAWHEADLLAPPVSAAAVGLTLGRISRPRLIEEARG